MVDAPILLFAALSLLGLAGAFTTGIQMCRYLEKRQVKINYWLIRFLIFKYVKQYKEITIRESGQPGPLYRRFMNFIFIYAVCISITLLLVLT